VSWADFIRSHMAVLTGIDLFTVEVLTRRGLATYHVLFFLHLETRRVTLAGTTQHPTEEWMVRMAHRAVDEVDGALPQSVFCCMIATASSALPFEIRFAPSAFNRSARQRAVPI
jgi:hypothetical protein